MINYSTLLVAARPVHAALRSHAHRIILIPFRQQLISATTAEVYGTRKRQKTPRRLTFFLVDCVDFVKRARLPSKTLFQTVCECV